MNVAPDSALALTVKAHRTFPSAYSSVTDHSGTSLLVSPPVQEADVKVCMKQAFTDSASFASFTSQLMQGPGSFPDTSKIEIWQDTELVKTWEP